MHTESDKLHKSWGRAGETPRDCELASLDVDFLLAPTVRRVAGVTLSLYLLLHQENHLVAACKGIDIVSLFTFLQGIGS